MIFRSCMSRLSIALAVSITRRTAGGNATNGITCSQARCQLSATVGHFTPQGPAANSARAAWAASALGAAQIGHSAAASG
jgi:hypothetical protein